MESKRLRILHIDIEKGWRGGQKQSFLLHSMLSNEGHSSIMICRKNSELEKRCGQSNLKILSISYLGEFDIRAGLLISRVCKKEKIQIIIAHSSHSLSLGLIAKMLNKQIKLIAVRRVDFAIGNNRLSIWKYSSKMLNKIVCVSDYIRRVISINHIIQNKSLTITSGIDIVAHRINTDKNKLRAKFKIPENYVIAGTVAAFVGHKDYDTLIRAIKIVTENIKNIIFLFVGEGKLKSGMMNLAKQLGLNSFIRFEGFQSNISDYLNLFDVFILSSKMEGLGTSIFDAQSVGVPVIATQSGGIPEIIINGYNGELVPPQNPKLLADAIVKFCENENYRKKISANSLITVKEYDIQITYQKYLKLFNELLND